MPITPDLNVYIIMNGLEAASDRVFTRGMITKSIPIMNVGKQKVGIGSGLIVRIIEDTKTNMSQVEMMSNTSLTLPCEGYSLFHSRPVASKSFGIEPRLFP